MVFLSTRETLLLRCLYSRQCGNVKAAAGGGHGTGVHRQAGEEAGNALKEIRIRR